MEKLTFIKEEKLNTISNEDLGKKFLESITIEQLENKLQKIGVLTSRPSGSEERLDFVTDLMFLWENLNEDKHLDVEDIKCLPGSTVNRGPTKVFVHGVIHPNVETPYLSYIREGFDKCNEDDLVLKRRLYEAGLDKCFGLNVSSFLEINPLKELVQFDYMTKEYFFECVKEFMNRGAPFVKGAILPSFLSELANLPTDFRHEELQQLFEAEINFLGKEKLETRDDFLYLRERLKKLFLPEPLNMNVEKYLKPDKSYDIFRAGITIAEAVAIAREAFRLNRAYAGDEKRLSRTEVHALVGLFHEDGIVYLLRNYNQLLRVKQDRNHVIGL